MQGLYLACGMPYSMATMEPSISLGLIGDGADPGRASRSDARQNRSRILETAEALFARHGVEAVNMADIATLAGVGKGTLYRRFANKGELCLALMDEQMRQFQETMLARLRQMSLNEVAALAQLAHFLDTLVYFTHQHMPLLCEVQRHSQELDEASRVMRPHFWQYMTVHGLLQTAVRRGELPAGADTAYLAEALLAPLTVTTFRFQLDVLAFSLERISAGLQFMVAGLASLPTAPE